MLYCIILNGSFLNRSFLIFLLTIEKIMKTLLDFLAAPKKVYDSMVDPICEKYDLSSTELTILAFLAEHPEADTAKDILLFIPITKSHVSMKLRSLEEKGYITGEYRNGNRRTIHLSLSDKAQSVISEVLIVKEEFQQLLLKGFSKKERDEFADFIDRIFNNLRNNEILG